MLNMANQTREVIVDALFEFLIGISLESILGTWKPLLVVDLILKVSFNLQFILIYAYY